MNPKSYQTWEDVENILIIDFYLLLGTHLWEILTITYCWALLNILNNIGCHLLLGTPLAFCEQRTGISTALLQSSRRWVLKMTTSGKCPVEMQFDFIEIPWEFLESRQCPVDMKFAFSVRISWIYLKTMSSGNAICLHRNSVRISWI